MHLTSLLVLCLLQSASAVAATAPAVEAPSTAPAAAPTTRPRLVVPPGFVPLDVDGRHFLIEPGDESLVRGALARLAPVTRPSTLPADLLATLHTRTAEVASLLAADLGIPEPEATEFLRSQLIPSLEDFNRAPVETVLLVTTRSKIADLLRSGWQVPSVRLNRASGEVEFSQVLVLASDKDSADALIPIIIPEPASDPAATTQARTDKLLDDLRALDLSVLRARSQRGQFLLQLALVRFIGEAHMQKFDLAADQEWLAAGITGTLTAKYTSMISGVPRRAIISAMVSEPPPARMPPGFIRAASVNLLSPVSPADLRPGAVVPYADAIRRKSVRAVDELLLKHGDEAIPKILTALRNPPPPATTRPASGPELVALIQSLTGTDLTPLLR